MDNAVKHLYEFGPFQLDPAERLLLRASERLDLPPKVYDVLVVLVESQGRLLEKTDLMDRVWPGTAVEENNLTQAIYQLRKILQDGESGARYIETVPKRGYRFVAPVRETDRETGSAEANNNAGASAGSHRERTEQSEARPQLADPAPVPDPAPPQTGGHASPFSRWIAGSRVLRFDPMIWIAGALVLTMVAGIAWRAGVSARSSDAPLIRSIAVLPLQNLSNDQAQEYFADGMTDELITELAHISELKVVSHTSVMQYKGTRKPLPQIGRELGVDAVVEGSVLRSGDRVRITAQLIRASNDRHLWAQSYEGELRNVLSLQSWVAEAITHEVRLTLDVREQEQLHAARNYDPEAYDLYLRGRYALRRRNLDAIHEAMAYYHQAAVRDPNFPLAYTGLADCYTLSALFGDGYPAVPEAMANARHALALDETLAEAHTSLGAAYVLDWKWPEAEKEFRRALELNPNDAQTHQWYGNLFLGPVGRHSEAIAEVKHALDLDPLSLVINADLGYAYFLADEDDLAFAQYQKVLVMDSAFLPVHYDLMLYYHKHGMFTEEINELVEDATLAGHPATAATVRRWAGQKQEFYEEIVKTGGRFDDSSNLPYSNVAVAQANVFLGRKQQALAALQKSVAERDTEMIYLKVEHSWDPLRDTPQFQDLMRTVGLPPSARQ
jgi:TolB-like protein/DNA-binding winged helix-turn-helix (wHTH) protein